VSTRGLVMALRAQGPTRAFLWIGLEGPPPVQGDWPSTERAMWGGTQAGTRSVSLGAPGACDSDRVETSKVLILVFSSTRR